MTYVTNGADTFTPTVVDGYDSARESRSIIHNILGRETPDVTIRPAALRAGTLRIVFDEAASKACEDAHATGVVFSLVSDLGTIEMSYIAAGRIARSIDKTRAAWILEVDYQEVGA
jgi:hypothetical protein